MSLLSLREAGLTEEEACALIEYAKSRIKEVDEHIDSYARTNSERAETSLRQKAKAGKIHQDQADELLALLSLQTANVAQFLPFSRPFTRDEKDTAYTEHPSFGAVEHTQYSSNKSVFVGTPSLERCGESLVFYQASLKDESRFKEPYLSENRQLLGLSLSSDQFSALVRNSNGESPCVLNRVNGNGCGEPPRMITSSSLAEDVEGKANAITQPLIQAIDSLMTYLQSDEKISTKSDYARLSELVVAVENELMAIHEPMKKLMIESAGIIGKATFDQMLADIQAPILALGLDVKSVLMLNHD